jgi:hypothetical protein
MTKPNEWPRGRSLVFLASIAAVAGCTSTPPPPPDQMARTKLQTAPADLQLLCAGAAANSAGIDASKVLPTSSSQLDPTSYAVELTAADRKFHCVIGADGKVTSVGPAA